MKMKLSKILCACLCFTLLLMNTQCDDDDQNNVQTCDQTVVVDNGFYNLATSDNFEFTNIFLNENCLTIEISSSGCDGNSWSMVLVDSGNIAESSPEQRYLKLVLTNNEECLAFVSQERSFDLTPVQVEGSNNIILNIEGYDEPLPYSY